MSAVINEVAVLPGVDRTALALRLVHQLDAAALTELVQFVEDRRDGTLVMLKDEGLVIDVQTHRRPRVREVR